MSESNDGGPAFPTGDGGGPPQGGMSLRDWFAAQAMAGVMGAVTELAGYTSCEALAGHAYKIADALLAERAKAKGGGR